MHTEIGTNETGLSLKIDRAPAVMLIGFLTQENLGLGYLASVLREAGCRVEVVDFEWESEKILARALELNPVAIGFSLIFQFYIPRFRTLIQLLRNNGVSCHFTMGGHFPSLSCRAALEFIPELDSIVRFEGEETLLELVDCLSADNEWRELKGIAFWHEGEVKINPERPLIADLDKLPYPERQFKPNQILGHTVVPILASRGCIRRCTFCSIHMFYRGAPGKVVRTRKPAEVVREMRHLFDHHGITIFLFQDDDFPLYGIAWQRWAREFVRHLHESGLAGKVLWKISCRADAVNEELFAEMREAGLYLVYMGIESGTAEGLQYLNKETTVAENLGAVRILKQLNLAFQFGFMLFEPSTTFDSIKENLKFLHAIVDDGCLAVTFCRMIPYDGTPIKDELERVGRLKGDICHPGYDFLDPRLDSFYDALTRVVDLTGWIHGYASLSPLINKAWGEVAILERLFPTVPEVPEYKERLRAITRASNAVLFQIVEEIMESFLENKPHRWTKQMLDSECARFFEQLLDTRNSFVLRHQPEILRVLKIDPAEAVAHA